MWSTLLLVASAQAADVEFVCNGESRVVGVAPLEVTCEARAQVLGTWADIEWFTGTGEVVPGDSFTVSYDEPGEYTVSMWVTDFQPAGGPLQSFAVRRDGAITVCGAPEPAFTVVNKGGRDYQMVNITPVATPRCLQTVEWEVMRGNGTNGPSLFFFDTWEPRFELPEDGEYTIVLSAGGLGGEATASRALDAEYGLTDDYHAVESISCSTSTGLALGWWLLPGLLVFRRRA